MSANSAVSGAGQKSAGEQLYRLRETMRPSKHSYPATVLTLPIPGPQRLIAALRFGPLASQFGHTPKNPPRLLRISPFA